jgi:hypothetical protein
MATYSSNKNCRSKSHSSTVGNCMENKTWIWFFSVLVLCTQCNFESICSRKIFEFQDIGNENLFLGTFRGHSKQPRCGCTLRVTSQKNCLIFSKFSPSVLSGLGVKNWNLNFAQNCPLPVRFPLTIRARTSGRKFF